MEFVACYLHVILPREGSEQVTAAAKVTSYLPVTKVVRQCSDRKKRVDLPLFKFLGIGARPAIVHKREIEVMKMLQQGSVEVSDSRLELGAEVIVSSGPMLGLRGKIANKRGKDRIVIRIESIDKNLLVDISPYNAEVAQPLAERLVPPVSSLTGF